MNILVLNCGSSSVKYSVWNTDEEKRLVSGAIDCIHVAGIPCKHIKNGAHISEEIAVSDHAGAVAFVIEMLSKEGIADIVAVGHRVVQGGDRFKEPVLVTDEVKEVITHYFDIAPLHNPSNLEGIVSCQKHYPSIPNVAVFDTAFHQTLPEVASTYAIPRYLAKKHDIKRYGFHGISHDYISREVAARYPVAKKIISCHLGNGSSITAIKYGKSVDTSMGFSPLEGLVMGTRPGDIDPEISLYLMEKENFTPGELLVIFNKQSGLAGISGISSDMRKLLSSSDADARLAVDVFCYRVKKYIGSYFAALDGADALVFTAGIGENSPEVRRRITDGLESLGIKIDVAKNESAQGIFADITASGFALKILVVPTNEDLLIARETGRVASAEKGDKVTK
ncbi:MAG: acetate kinase [Endomicrobiia bacterium]|nr:acetate kinase [Endomicrobiia bacterium]